MPSVVRDIAAEGIASIIRALPDECKIVLQIERLPRAKFGVFLEIETNDPPALRAVS